MKPLLDTDTVSLMLRGNASVTVRVGNYRRTEGPIAVSVIVLYEVLRGLKFLDAKLQMSSFQSFMRANEVIHLVTRNLKHFQRVPDLQLENWAN